MEAVSFLLAPPAATREVVAAIVAEGHEVGLLGELASAAGAAGGFGGTLMHSVEVVEQLLREAAGSAGRGTTNKGGAGAPPLQGSVAWYRPLGGARDSLGIVEASALGLRVALAAVALGKASAEVTAARFFGGGAYGGLDVGLHIALPPNAEVAAAAVDELRKAWATKEANMAEVRNAVGAASAASCPLVFRTLTGLHASAGQEREAIAN